HTHTSAGTGNLGEVRVRRSVDGGQTFGAEQMPFPAGTADASTNVGIFGSITSNPVLAGPSAVVTGDFDLDGQTDIVARDAAANRISFLKGNGIGGFAGAVNGLAGVGTSPVAMIAGDFDVPKD